jgi:hypothetical protein
MRTGRIMKSAIALGTALAVGWFSATAMAQPGGGGGGGGRGGPPLDPAKAAAAQKLQAEGVAHDLGITGDAVGKMVTAYQANRESQRKEMQALRESGQQGPDMFYAMQDINDKSRAALKAELEKAVGAEKGAAATEILGTYGREWDRYVDVYSGLGVGDDKRFQGLSLIAKYNVDVDKARMEAIQAMDMDGMRAAGEEHKAKLDAALKDVLSAEQLAKWTEGTARRGGGGGGGGPGGGPGAGAPPPPPPPQN